MVLALLVAMALLGQGRHINAVAAIALLIAPNVLGVVVWALLTVLERAQRNGAFGRAGGRARWRLAPQRAAQSDPRRARLDAQHLTAWVLGGLNHLLWAVVCSRGARCSGPLAPRSAPPPARLGDHRPRAAKRCTTPHGRSLAAERIGLPAPVPDLDDPITRACWATG